MSNNKPFRFGDRIMSFKFAMEGIISFFKTEHNAWIHCIAAVAVISAGFIFKINKYEWCWIISSISLVFILEMINTAIEILCDVVSPEINPQIKRIKDIAAGAVLVASLAAVVIGLIIFVPKLF
jgi:diacylglycerol kinase (ATP)